jgi:hypothetical protein
VPWGPKIEKMQYFLQKNIGADGAARKRWTCEKSGFLFFFFVRQ